MQFRLFFIHVSLTLSSLLQVPYPLFNLKQFIFTQKIQDKCIMYRLATLVYSQMKACYFQVFGEVLMLSTGNRFKWVDFNTPHIIFIVELSWISSLLLCTLLMQTSAQYFVSEYTNSSVLILSVFALTPHDVLFIIFIIYKLYYGNS